jgi:hypothetical protein
LAIEEVHQEALRVLKQTSAGLDTWTKLGADLGESRQRLDQLAVRLDKIAAGVEAGKGTAGKLITDTALADDASNLLARVNATLSEFQIVATNLNLAVDNIRTGTARLPEIADVAASEARELPGLVLQTRSSMIELERLMEALQREWLIRGYVNHTNPAPILPASEPSAPVPQPLNHFRSPKGFAN